jgi:hypothetical protein
MPLEMSWVDDLAPDEAQAALDALKANKAPVTASEATELLRLRRALQAKVAGFSFSRTSRGNS